MNRFRNTSIKTKVSLSISTAFLTVVVACAAFVWNDVRMMNAQQDRQTSTLAATLGASSLSALLVNDAPGANEVLSSLQFEPTVSNACTFDKQGNLFASFGETRDLPQFIDMPIPSYGKIHRGENYLEVAQPINRDHQQVGAVLLRMNLQEFNGQLWQYTRIFSLMLVFSIIIIWFTASVLHKSIAEPVIRMTRSMRQVSESGDYRHHVVKLADDELGELTDGFNEMLVQVEQRESEIRELNQQLIRTARIAGQAEVATSVLHNVGNVLNSVNVNATLLNEQIQTSRLGKLNSVVTLINEHDSNLGEFFSSDPRGLRLPGYLERLTEALILEQGDSTLLINSLRSNVDKIKRIVHAQQSYAVVSSVHERCLPREVMEEAMQIVSISFQKHNIEVVCEHELVAAIDVDKTKLIHILVNLISNAVDALRVSPKLEKTLTLRTALRDKKRVLFEVTDNGIGIKPAKLAKIFSYGFTTKVDGHGFGLHCAANDVNLMGGTLTATSEGIGTGATFIVELNLAVTPPVPTFSSDSVETAPIHMHQ